MAAGGVPRASGSRSVGSVEDIALDSGCRLIRCGDPVCGRLHEFGEVGYLNNSGNRSGIGLVGRSPWTAADARLLAGWPGGRPLARAPAPHRSTERGLPESSGYPNSPILLEPLPDQLCKARAGADDGLIAFGAGGDTAHFDAGAGLQKGNVLLG